MSLSEVGVPGQKIDVLHGGDVDAVGRLLSVAEIQQAFRELQARQPATGPQPGQTHRVAPAPSAPPLASIAAPPAELSGGTPAAITIEELAATHAPAPAPAPSPEPARRPSPANTPSVGHLPAGWTAVLAAHAGAGASTIALAITDVLAATGPARLIETAHPARSGLVAAAGSEMGLDATGSWRRGVRGTAAILRRAGDDAPRAWPEPDLPGQATVVDLGLPAPTNLARLAEDGPHLVVVCRPSIPGTRLAEHVLTVLPSARVVVAIGPRKWPSEVVASLGPRLRELRAAGQVVCVEEDRRLQITGPTHTELPRHLTTAASDALRLLDPARDGAASSSAHQAPRSRMKGTSR